MAFKIGFAAEHPENKPAEVTYTAQQMQAAPRKSVVQVYFAGRNMTLAYYNDQFDLHRGDMVYVDGKLEGMSGRVTEVNYNFKHEFAAMLQLKETLELISKHYADEYERTGYFAAVNKGTLFAFAIDGKETGSFTL